MQWLDAERKQEGEEEERQCRDRGVGLPWSECKPRSPRVALGHTSSEDRYGRLTWLPAWGSPWLVYSLIPSRGETVTISVRQTPRPAWASPSLPLPESRQLAC